MVEYQWASILISHNHGRDDIMVSAKNTMYMAAHTVFFHIYFLPSSTVNFFPSLLRESCLIFRPSNVHKTIVNNVQMVKKVLLRNGALCNNASSCFTTSVSVQ